MVAQVEGQQLSAREGWVQIPGRNSDFLVKGASHFWPFLTIVSYISFLLISCFLS